MPITAESYQPSFGWRAKVTRQWTARRVVAPLGAVGQGFTLSLSFDDVPDSAATRGAEVLAEAGVTASWYVATGLLGEESPSGRVLDAARVRELAGAGHEIALHGHAHHDLSRLRISEARADLARNRAELSDILGHAPSAHLAYPYGETTLALKRDLQAEVLSARGLLARPVRTGSDRMQLAAFDLRPDPAYLARASGAIERAAQQGGWLVLFTHDVAPDPSAYGVTPQILRDLIGQAQSLGAQILPVGQAFAQIAPR